MALVLSLKVNEDFYVADEQFRVLRIVDDCHFKLLEERTGRVLDITDEHGTEVVPDVFVSAGDRPQTGMARVAIEAPQDILILRGEKYRNPPAHIQERERA
jgi:sRNA-binding carbon storage regulator CsrA